MTKELLSKWLLLVTVSGLCLVAAEGWVRWVGSEDQDGNLVFFRRTLRPYRIPIESVRAKVAAYLAAGDSFVAYDPELGWSPRSGGRSRNGLYCYDREGIRTTCEPEPSAVARAEVAQIRLFGDSFTHGDDVGFESTWGLLLNEYLERSGFLAKTSNFGVGGYGIDQAYLRWRKAGRRSPSRFVILGFQATDVKRNVNLLRPLNNPGTSLPFSKPRFVLEAGGLRLINTPALPPLRLVEVMEQLDSWELRRYEGFLERGDFEERWWGGSRLIAAGVTAAAEWTGRAAAREETWYRLDGEPARVTLRIVERFAREAADEGATFVIVHLPKWDHLATLLARRELPYQALLGELDRRHTLIDPSTRLLRSARDRSLDSLFVGHYSETANRIVAEAVGEALLEMLDSESGARADGR